MQYDLYEVIDFDSVNNCYLLAKAKKQPTSQSKYLIGIRINTEFISKDREGLRLLVNSNSEPGYKGHLDTVSRIYFVDGNSNTTNDILLQKPADISYFKVKDSVLLNNQINSTTNCYITNRQFSIEDLVERYNLSKAKDFSLDNTFFFTIDSSQFSHIANHNYSLQADIRK